jgi:hypothetical protein
MADLQKISPANSTQATIDKATLIVHDLFAKLVRCVMLLIHNERTKLTASWLNTIATALMAAGAFAPAAAWLYGLSSLPIGALYLSALAVACIAGGAALHISGLALLGRLRE